MVDDTDAKSARRTGWMEALAHRLLARPQPRDPMAAAAAAEVFEPLRTPVAAGQVWIDLLDPGEAEVARVAAECGMRIPSREDLSEIESSSRHYVEKGALYLSAPLVTHAETKEPELSPVGFIVTRERLVTIRFDKLRAFEAAAPALQKAGSGLEAFVVLVEAIIDRKADLLELQGQGLEDLSKEVFRRPGDKKRNGDELRGLLRRVGDFGDRGGKMRGSLLAIGRLLPFVVDTSGGKLEPEFAQRLHAAKEDVVSLTAYQENLASKTQFLLDAALGFIQIEQNDVFKILTVVSAVGVPPTLVASIYGMNFKAMPELEWRLGYPYALGLIVLTTVVPLLWFRKKGWF